MEYYQIQVKRFKTDTPNFYRIVQGKQRHCTLSKHKLKYRFHPLDKIQDTK